MVLVLRLPRQLGRSFIGTVGRKAAHGRLDVHFLAGHELPSTRSLPLRPDLHTELVRLWDEPYSAWLHFLQHADYPDTVGVDNRGCLKMPPVKGELSS